MAVVLVPGVLASEAGGQNRFELDAATIGEALRALPVRDLVLDEHGDVRPDLAMTLPPAAQVRIVAAIAGG